MYMVVDDLYILTRGILTTSFKPNEMEANVNLTLIVLFRFTIIRSTVNALFLIVRIAMKKCLNIL